MTLRNKYVHYDESSQHNKLGQVYFDGDFPLLPASDEAPGVVATKQIYHYPDSDTIANAYNSAFGFVNFIESLIIDEYRDGIIQIVNANPVAFNERRKVYSAIYPHAVLDFFASGGPHSADRPKESA